MRGSNMFHPRTPTEQLAEICAPLTTNNNDEVRSSVIQSAIDFLTTNKDSYINFYALPINFFELAAYNNQLMQLTLNHPSMRGRSDHFVHHKLFFEALATAMYLSEISNTSEEKSEKCLSCEALIEFYNNKIKPKFPKTTINLTSVQKFFKGVHTKTSLFFDECFSHYPRKELWRLFYDVNKQLQKNKFGWTHQEWGESGFLLGMAHAFNAMHTSIDEPLTPKLLEELHINACRYINISDNKDYSTHEEFEQYRDDDSQFGIEEGDNATLGGLIEIAHMPHYGKIFSIIEKHKKVYIMYCIDGNYKQAISLLINHYNAAINRPDITPLDRLYYIVDLVKTLILIHPFFDANCRVICTLLTMRELMRNGFPPAMLDDPNRFAGYSRQECVRELIQGMENFMAIQVEFDKDRFGNSTQTILDLLDGKIAERENPKYDAAKKAWEDALLVFSSQGFGCDNQISPLAPT